LPTTPVLLCLCTLLSTVLFLPSLGVDTGLLKLIGANGIFELKINIDRLRLKGR
jgi:hypothetical protein